MEGKKINWMQLVVAILISVVISVIIMHFTKVVNATTGVDTGNKLKLVA